MTPDLNTLRQHLKAVLQASAQEGRGLPGAFYTDPSWLDAEVRELFSSQWVCCGRKDEIPEPGDHFSFEVAGEPLLIIHGEDGVIRALSNVCRHRGTVLVEGAGHSNRLVCPYHHWSYDLQGNLLSAPGMEGRGGFRRKAHCLPELPVTEWQGFLFVSLSENPDELDPELAELTERIGNYHLEQMRLGHMRTEIWNTNWKCLFENFMEGYHLSALHRKTLHRVNPSRLCRHFPAGDHYLGYTVGFTERVGEGTSGHPDLTEEERNTCVMFGVTPSLVVGIGSDYSSFICLHPVDAGHVRAKMGLIFYGDNWSMADREKAVTLFHDTMMEDKTVLLSLQQGLKSEYYVPGPLAPQDLEGTCHDLHRYLANRMAGENSEEETGNHGKMPMAE